MCSRLHISQRGNCQIGAQLPCRPDLLVARGGITADEEALLDEFGLGVGPNAPPHVS